MIYLAILVVAVHAAWLFLVIFGAMWTRRRPIWSGLHVAALLWGIAVEAGPWPCPLTLAENYFEASAGHASYLPTALLHLLNSIVYPDLAGWIVTLAGVTVCVFNLFIYVYRIWRARIRKGATRG